MPAACGKNRRRVWSRPGSQGVKATTAVANLKHTNHGRSFPLPHHYLPGWTHAGTAGAISSLSLFLDALPIHKRENNRFHV